MCSKTEAGVLPYGKRDRHLSMEGHELLAEYLQPFVEKTLNLVN